MTTATRIAKIGVLAAAMVLAFGTVGCATTAKLGRYDLVVTPDATLRDSGTGRLPPVEVDLVGVGAADAAQWQSYGADQYFSGEDARRKGAASYAKTLTFNADNQGPQTIKATDPIWKLWQQRGVTTLFVFASSRTMKTTPGGPEIRRKEIPLTTDKWESGTRRIDIVVKSSGVDCPTPMKVMK